MATQPWVCLSRFLPLAFAVAMVVGDKLTIVVAGELDMANHFIAFDALHDALADSMPRNVVIDLAALTFCDVAGARAIGCAHRLAVARGATCRVRNARPHIERLLLIIQPGVMPTARRQR
ncbi:STAS domain-containing protein [Actinoplanes sp. NPDC051346]|uniref:STAS domain-containing protein n=1 Tax=Actinoplanes sp. NPDC051346 TaxID=3155048 RepID=UPI00341D12EE